MVLASFFRVPVLTISSSGSAFAARKSSTARSDCSMLPWRDCMVRLLFVVGRGGAGCAMRVLCEAGTNGFGAARHPMVHAVTQWGMFGISLQSVCVARTVLVLQLTHRVWMSPRRLLILGGR